MRVSISVSNQSLAADPAELADRLVEVARAAEDSGVDTVWLPDHLVQADPTVGERDRDVLEVYTALAFIAAATARIRLGALVSPAMLRPPALLVKAVTTLDVLSHGRAWLGLGAGYLTTESVALALPLADDVATRFEHLEDTVAIAHHLWSGSVEPFHGRHHTLMDPELVPGPAAAPHPPILIGGTGERRTLRLVAQHADACNLFDLPDGDRTLRHKLGVLDRHCAEVGRPPDEVERTVSTRQAPDQTAPEFGDRCARLSELGVDHVIVHSGRAWTPGAVRELRPVIERLAAA